MIQRYRNWRRRRWELKNIFVYRVPTGTACIDQKTLVIQHDDDGFDTVWRRKGQR